MPKYLVTCFNTNLSVSFETLPNAQEFKRKLDALGLKSGVYIDIDPFKHIF